MGIRFYCPNGHKLNVKEKLAGKRGICPRCGVKLLIPQKSTRPSSREEHEQQQKLAANAGGNPNDFDVFADDQSTAEYNLTFDGNDPTDAAPPVPTSAFDDPSVVWYVQLPDGQRFGPATLPVMQSWVSERRIGPNMLVWREGWTDWIEARQVFPEIEQVFRDWQTQKSQHKSHQPPVRQSFDENVIEKNSGGFSFLMIAAIAVVIAAFGVVLYYLLK